MKGALVTFLAKVEGVVKEKLSGAEPQTPTSCPPIKIPGGATDNNAPVEIGTSFAMLFSAIRRVRNKIYED